MSEQSQPESHQSVDVNDSSISKSNVGQVIGGNLTQIQGEVVNVTVYDSVDVASLGGRQASGTVKPLTQQDYRNRKVLLNKVKKFWIEGVLEKSLHIKALIELGLEERLDAVARPFQDVQEIPDESRQTLPSGTDATQVFNQMGEGRTLLIVGEPGAGKTTILLKLAQNLIAHTEEDLNQPIPVVFNLSSWASERQTIADWLIEELSSKYQVSKALGKAWVEEQQLLLLLDGLDEVKAERREACVHALNQFIQEYGQTEIVVCSRIRDYEALSARLKLQGAICIQSLTLNQINDYLERAGEQLEAVKTLLQEDTALQELAKAPLTLSVMTLAYQGISVEDLPKTGSVEERRKHLLNAYIERMFKRKGAVQQYSISLTIRWLNWLAQRMFQETKTVFLIEKIQPSWLSKRFQVTVYAIAVQLIILPAGVMLYMALHYFIPQTFPFGIAYIILMLLIAVIGGVRGAINPIKLTIEPVERIKWSWSTANKNFLHFINPIIHNPIVLPSLGISIFSYIVLGLVNPSDPGLVGGVISGLCLLVGYLLTYVICGLRSPNIQIGIIPNQGIWTSMKNGIGTALIGIITSLIAAFSIKVVIQGEVSLFLNFFYGLFASFLMVAYALGLIASIQHFILRIFLTWNGLVPWNYARFLDYATDRIFLQKVGGGYIFIHRLLLEHFAQMELE